MCETGIRNRLAGLFLRKAAAHKLRYHVAVVDEDEIKGEIEDKDKVKAEKEW